MEIHRPKSLESWREFAKEVCVIVLGVMIALAGEQTVEWMHWSHEVSETRDALNREVAHNLGVLQARAAQGPCISARLADIGKTLDAKGARPTLVQPLFWRPQTSVWKAALAGQVVAHMPLDLRLRYASLYDYLDWFAARETEEADAWSALAAFNDPAANDPQAAWSIRQAKARELTVAAKVDAYLPVLSASAKAFGVAPEPVQQSPALGGEVAALCRPMA
jgi:hypothetical protein